MKSPGIYGEKTNSSGVKATIKVGKNTVPNNEKQKVKKKDKRAAKISPKLDH